MVQFNLPFATLIQLTTFLLPGFLALKIRDGLTRTDPDPRRINEAWLPALLFDLPIFLFTVLIGTFTPLHSLLDSFTGNEFSLTTMAVALVVASVFGLVAGAAEERSFFTRVMRKLKLSQKTWRNTWADTFKAAGKENCWVVVQLKNGTRILGIPKFYSADSENPEIFLTRSKDGGLVEVISPNEKEPYQVKGPGVLITPDAEVTRLEFLHPRQNSEAPPAQEKEV